MSKIELRLSDIEPPEPDPKRTIYRDIANLPDPVKLGLTVRYFNHDDVDLYFQITGEATGYTFQTVNLGLLGSGKNAYKNLDEFASRAKPSESELTDGEMEETIKLILKAYTDSDYTNLKWTFERYVTVHWINSADPAFTIDVLNNFDDGTVQGWEGYTTYGTYTLGVAIDYVLSTPYSLKLTSQTGYYTDYCEIYKDFTTPDKNKVFAIFDVRVSHEKPPTDGVIQQLNIRRNTTVLVFLGRRVQMSRGEGDFLPRNKWLRIVVPLPRNTSLTLRVRVYSASIGTDYDTYLWLDDFKIISK